jgi:hypothetical protein
MPVVLSTFTFDYSIPGIALPTLSTSTTTGTAAAGNLTTLLPLLLLLSL